MFLHLNANRPSSTARAFSRSGPFAAGRPRRDGHACFHSRVIYLAVLTAPPTAPHHTRPVRSLSPAPAHVSTKRPSLFTVGPLLFASIRSRYTLILAQVKMRLLHHHIWVRAVISKWSGSRVDRAIRQPSHATPSLDQLLFLLPLAYVLCASPTTASGDCSSIII
ncbi:hypothetical protein BKA80DRAFT_264634 [Phyllosticta citrichinensis]